MANPLKGEVDLVCGDKTYTLRMSINEIIQLGKLTGMKVKALSAALADTDDVDLDLWRSALWTALQEHHKHGVSLEDAGEIMAGVTIPVTIAKVSEALQLSFPAPEEDAPASPRKASRSGTGKPS